MKNIFITLILSTVLSTNMLCQEISAGIYNNELIHEDFRAEGEIFPIITTSDNYFIIDKGDYLLSRNNEDSEYAIIANKSSVNDFILKTSLRIGPNNNKNSSIGIIIKAQQDGKGAIIFEINKKGEYRIKQLSGNSYRPLSGSKKDKGWVKNKTIKKVDEHNSIEIRSEKNIYEIYINSDYLTTFFMPDYTSGSCGLIISSGTKARVSYYYINTKIKNESALTSYTNKNTTEIANSIKELNKKIEILEKNNLELNSLNKNSRQNQDNKIKTLIKNITELESNNVKNSSKINELKNENNTLTIKINTLTEEQTTNLEINNTKILNLESNNLKNNILISKLNNEKDALTIKINTLTEEKSSISTKNTELAKVTIDQESEIVILKENIANHEKNTKIISQLKNENDSLNIKANTLAEENNSINTKNTELAKVTIDQEKAIASMKENILNLEKNNLKIINLESKNLKNTKLISKLNNENDAITIKINTLTEENNSISAKNTELAKVTIDQETDASSLRKKNDKLISELFDIKTSKNILTTELANAKNATERVRKKLSKSIIKKTTEIKQLISNSQKTSNQLNSLMEIKAQHDKVKNDLNANIIHLNNQIQELSSQLDLANNNITSLNTKNSDLKKLFFLKDFELNGIKPSELIKEKNIYSAPKEIKDSDNNIYAVQFGVYMQMQPYSSLEKLDDVWYKTTENGTYVYLSGEFKSPSEATSHKNSLISLGYPNAFVVTISK